MTALSADPMHHAATWVVPLRADALALIEPELDAVLVGSTGGDRGGVLGRLVVEEIVRNLIEHTPPYAADESCEVTVEVRDETVVVTIEDTRPPFDPLEAPALDVDAPLESRRPGGMGLHLVRSLSHELTYERVGDRNRLTSVLLRS